MDNALSPQTGGNALSGTMPYYGSPIAGSPDNALSVIPGLGAAGRARQFGRLADTLINGWVGRQLDWRKGPDGVSDRSFWDNPGTYSPVDQVIFNAPTIYRGITSTLNGERNPISPGTMESLGAQASSRRLMSKDPVEFDRQASDLLGDPRLTRYIGDKLPPEYMRWREGDNWDKTGIPAMDPARRAEIQKWLNEQGIR